MFDHLTTALVHVANHQSTAKPPSSRRRDGDEKQQKKKSARWLLHFIQFNFNFSFLRPSRRELSERGMFIQKESCVLRCSEDAEEGSKQAKKNVSKIMLPIVKWFFTSLTLIQAISVARLHESVDESRARASTRFISLLFHIEKSLFDFYDVVGT